LVLFLSLSLPPLLDLAEHGFHYVPSAALDNYIPICICNSTITL
jgi:hypothetical protein